MLWTDAELVATLAELEEMDIPLEKRRYLIQLQSDLTDLLSFTKAKLPVLQLKLSEVLKVVKRGRTKPENAFSAGLGTFLGCIGFYLAFTHFFSDVDAFSAEFFYPVTGVCLSISGMLALVAYLISRKTRRYIKLQYLQELFRFKFVESRHKELEKKLTYNNEQLILPAPKAYPTKLSDDTMTKRQPIFSIVVGAFLFIGLLDLYLTLSKIPSIGLTHLLATSHLVSFLIPGAFVLYAFMIAIGAGLHFYYNNRKNSWNKHEFYNLRARIRESHSHITEHIIRESLAGDETLSAQVLRSLSSPPYTAVSKDSIKVKAEKTFPSDFIKKFVTTSAALYSTYFWLGYISNITHIFSLPGIITAGVSCVLVATGLVTLSVKGKSIYSKMIENVIFLSTSVFAGYWNFASIVHIGLFISPPMIVVGCLLSVTIATIMAVLNARLQKQQEAMQKANEADINQLENEIIVLKTLAKKREAKYETRMQEPVTSLEHLSQYLKFNDQMEVYQNDMIAMHKKLNHQKHIFKACSEGFAVTLAIFGILWTIASIPTFGLGVVIGSSLLFTALYFSGITFVSLVAGITFGALNYKMQRDTQVRNVHHEEEELLGEVAKHESILIATQDVPLASPQVSPQVKKALEQVSDPSPEKTNVQLSIATLSEEIDDVPGMAPAKTMTNDLSMKNV